MYESPAASSLFPEFIAFIARGHGGLREVPQPLFVVISWAAMTSKHRCIHLVFRISLLRYVCIPKICRRIQTVSKHREQRFLEFRVGFSGHFKIFVPKDLQKAHQYQELLKTASIRPTAS